MLRAEPNPDAANARVGGRHSQITHPKHRSESLFYFVPVHCLTRLILLSFLESRNRQREDNSLDKPLPLVLE